MIQHHMSALNVIFLVKTVTIWAKNVQNASLGTSSSLIISAVHALEDATNVHHQSSVRYAISTTIGQIKGVNAYAVKDIF